jgi:hypothetical protein
MSNGNSSRRAAISAGASGFGMASRWAPARHLTPVIVVLAAIAGVSGAFASVDRVFVNVVAIALALSAVMYGITIVMERLLKPADAEHDDAGRST